MRIPPAQGVIRGPGQDWMGRGPSVKKKHLFFHAGLDINNHGKPVVAPEPGRVSLVADPIPSGKSVFGGYGPAVVALHGESGLFHWLGHVKDTVVKPNQRVDIGDIVALSTGTKVPHVHWEIRKELIPYSGKKYWPWTVSIDPVRFLRYAELTGLEAYNYVKQYLPAEWKDRDKRMQVIRTKKRYPIRLSWEKGMKESVKAQIYLLSKTDPGMQLVVGVGVGLALLYVLM